MDYSFNPAEFAMMVRDTVMTALGLIDRTSYAIVNRVAYWRNIDDGDAEEFADLIERGNFSTSITALNTLLMENMPSVDNDRNTWGVIDVIGNDSVCRLNITSTCSVTINTKLHKYTIHCTDDEFDIFGLIEGLMVMYEFTDSPDASV